MKLKSALVVSGVLVFVVGFVSTRPSQPHVCVNNQRCPVSGNQVNDQHTYVYKGKEYKLCSEECKEPLSENPEKYLSD